MTRTIPNRAIVCLGTIGVMCVLTTLAVSAPSGPRGTDIKVSAKVELPAIIAVRIRHDMCPYCKSFDPKFPTLTLQSDSKSVLFVTLDLSNETTQRQAAMLVSALGLEKVWTGDMSRMGSIVFVDGATREIISTVMQVDTKKVAAAMHKAVASRRRS